MLACLLAGLSVVTGAGATEPVIRFATLDWPPFSGNLPAGGSAAAIMANAYAQQGRSMASTVLPWKRAVSLGMDGDGMAGFYPASPVECANAGGELSKQPIGHYQFALAQREASPFTWETAADLSHIRIGIVDGYDNGPLINGLSQAGSLVAEIAQNDLVNLRKLQAGRIDAAVVEISQFATMAPALNRAAADTGLSRLSLNPRPLGPADAIHVCFNHSMAAKTARIQLDKGLAGLDVPALQAAYMARHVPELNPTN
jgi:hypothetical protein